MSDTSAFDANKLIWIDETGSDQRNEIRKYGYSLKGKPARACRSCVSGKCYSAIPVMTTSGIEDVYITTGGVNGDSFKHFICKCMLPILLLLDSHNPHSIVIIDNASIQHVVRVWEIITGVGAGLMFLPPYSPDLMPLKEVFAKVKAVLKANDNAYISTESPEHFIKLAFSTVSKDD